MHIIGKNQVFQINYQEWPLFRKFRKTTEFMNTYEEIYGKPFVYEEMKEVESSESFEITKEIRDSVN